MTDDERASLVVHDLGDGATIEELVSVRDGAALGKGGLGKGGSRAGGFGAGVAGAVAPALAATRWVAVRPDMWPVALAGFLARGGAVLLALPILVLPSPIGIASFVGADAITAAGPTDRFIALVAAAVVAVAIAAVVALVLGAATDRAVFRAWANDANPTPRDRPGPVRVGLRLVGVRIVSAVPLAVGLAWAIPRIADAGYRQLVLPDDVATPLIVRVLASAPEAVAAVVAGLLVGELLAGLGCVHVAVDGASVARAVVRSVLDVIRRPGAVLASFLGGVALAIALVAPPLALAVLAWELARRALAGPSDPVFVTLAVALLVGAWLAALMLAGVAAAWRRVAIAASIATPADPSQTPLGATPIGGPVGGSVGPSAALPTR